ncbi:A1S_1983 family putative colistin resistance protein [Acinetobacter colistiniresistens]|uniref:DUF1311 domain-containing protein n=1 Tax=Acinetobacter colistiniresistens TaxID=280145 RepID=S3TAI3_9GAMM|nr:hypothetical protein [Acinetobacter colistiniresistens]EPG37948.1 hypothetical protein F907_01918 [Acinetobacter colistiniresistens]TVT84741.1 hypothetical protein FPV60_05270 [Acinetobacter colistiniresistens]
MLFNTVRNQLKKSGYIITLSCFCSTFAYAEAIDCTSNDLNANKICSKQYKEQRLKLNTKFLTAYLVTDAPLQLLHDTQSLWLNQVQQCKSKNCYQQQFDARLDDLNFYTSMNQTLTQHYLKYEHGKLAAQPVHLQIHQLDKDKLKIEGTAYRSPNNRLETQTQSLLAYSTPEQRNQIIDNEKKCQYQFDFQKALLIIKSEQKDCSRFTGIYRLYD